MSDANRDENHIPVALGQSSTDPTVTLPFKIDSSTGRLLTDNVSGSGTVTQLDGGVGILLTPDPITTTGTIALATALQPIATLTGNSLKFLRVNVGETAVEYATISTGITIGTTTITGGTNTRVLYNNAGVVGEYVVSGSGNVAMTTNAVLTTPNIGTPSAGTLTNCTGLPVATGISGLGTGVATALAVNVGSAGAFVVLDGALGTPSSGTLTNATGLPIVAGTTGTLSVARGGTGVVTISALSVWVANSADTITEVTPGAGQSIRINGAGNAWEAFTPSSSVPTTITVANEATDTTCFLGFFTAATGDLGPKTNANLTFNSNTGVLTLVAPVLGTPTSVTLTNATGLPVATGISGLGTGVATALAINVGSAGAFVTLNGALGTPSSGTLTNCTGLPTAGLVNNAVTYAKIQQASAGFTIMAKADTGAGNYAELAAGADGVLRRSGSGNLAFGTIVEGNIADDAVTLAKMAAGTAGNLITYDASGNPAAVATGTSGHILTSNGAGAAPTFQAPAGGGVWTLIANAQLGGTSSTLINATGISTDYDAIKITYCALNSTSSNELQMRFNSDTGATQYFYEFNSGGASNTSRIVLSVNGLASGDAVSGSMVISKPVTTSHALVSWSAMLNDVDQSSPNRIYNCDGGGSWINTDAKISTILIYGDANWIAGSYAIIEGRTVA